MNHSRLRFSRKILLFILCCIPAFLSAQSWTDKLSPDAGFEEMEEAFNEYYDSGKVIPRADENPLDDEKDKFERWAAFVKPRLTAEGKLQDASILLKEWFKEKNRPSYRFSSSATPAAANWSIVGPQVLPSDGGGVGRINTLEFDPLNSNIMYIGSAGGGVWKSVNAGGTWQNLTNSLPVLSFADIAIHPQHTDTIYIASGDNYGYANNGDFWGGTYSGGIFKSYDGGASWDTAGLFSSQFQLRTILRMIIDPANPNILLAATKAGLFRSTDAAQTWTQVSTVTFYDLEIQPGHPERIYAGATGKLFVSSDTGATWSLAHTFSGGSGRTSIAVTPANPNMIYFWTESGGFYKSSNLGNTFVQRASPQATFTFNGYYDMALGVSNTDSNDLFVGGLNVVESTDGALNWNEISAWNQWGQPEYVHADEHDIQFLPGSGTTLFVCNDGGIFKSTNGGTSWTDLSNGLAITQFYRLGTSFTNPQIVYGGAQDNGTVRLSNTLAPGKVIGGDGMECMVDYTDENIVYASYQNGALRRSIDGGFNFTDISPSSSGAWTTPMIMHPTDPATIYVGTDDVYKSNDYGQSWTPMAFNAPADLEILALCPMNVNYIYAGIGTSLFRTTDGGLNWTNITAGLSSGAFTGLTVSYYDGLRIWISVSNYLSGKKVYTSKDGGHTWVNISGSLPNIPANCILYQRNTPDLVYIGTDFGVYYRDSTMADWLPYNTGLPAVVIDELEINYNSKKLVAATYGRGIWETDLAIPYFDNTGIQDIPFSDSGVRIIPNPVKSTASIHIRNFNNQSLDFRLYDITGREVDHQTLSSNVNIFDRGDLSSGIYFWKVRDNSGAPVGSGKMVVE